MAIPVQDDRREVADILALSLGDAPQVLGGRCGYVNDRCALGSDGDLLHVDARPWVEHGVPVADGDHCYGVGSSQGGECRPVDRVNGDVGCRGASVTDALTVVQHWCFVLLALTDDDDAVHGDAVQHVTHGVDRSPVSALLVAPSHPAGGSECGGLGHPTELEGKVAVGYLSVISHGSGTYPLS